MPLTAETMQAATGCPRGVALTWAPYLTGACGLYGITTPARLSAFLAQIGHESAGFTATVENLNYSAQALLATWPSRFTPATAAAMARKPQAIAEHVYGGRMGNGPEGSGDGYKYRGRGLVQITGKANYEAVSEQLARHGCPDLLVLPDTLSEPKWAALSATAFWDDHGLNELADAGSFDTITRRINGGQTGVADRRARYERARKALA
jgi:putative chitinase